jgi:hypothetical protein
VKIYVFLGDALGGVVGEEEITRATEVQLERVGVGRGARRPDHMLVYSFCFDHPSLHPRSRIYAGVHIEHSGNIDSVQRME